MSLSGVSGPLLEAELLAGVVTVEGGLALLLVPFIWEVGARLLGGLAGGSVGAASKDLQGDGFDITYVEI